MFKQSYSHSNHSTLGRREAKPIKPYKIVDADAYEAALPTVELVHCSKKMGGVSWMTSKSRVQPKKAGCQTEQPP